MADYPGGCYETVIEGRIFTICTKRDRDEPGGKPTGEWYAWCFFAYDRSLSIFPADAVPQGVKTRESIAGASGDAEDEARRAVEEKLRRVIKTKSLDGTGFYSPPGGFTYPQELLDSE